MVVGFAFASNAVFNFLVGLFVARFLGPEEFGRFAIASATAVLINTAGFDWIRLSAVRFYSARTRSDRPQVRATLDACFGALAAIVSLAAVAVSLSGLKLTLSPGLLLMAATTAVFSAFFDYRTALARARFHDGAYARTLIVKNTLGLVLTGYVSAKAVGASIPIIMTATGIGQIYAMAWAARLAQNAVAAVFGIFGGFWLSFAVLVLALGHNWFVLLTAGTGTVELFLTTWLIVIVMLTLATLRLPVAYTAVFALVDLALLLVFLGVNGSSTGLLKTAGYVVLVFAAIGVYLYASTASVATGGRPYPLGRPTVR